MKNRLWTGWAVCILSGGLPVEAEQVLLSEVMYHPQALQPEFVEIYNQTATPFDIAEWKLRGGVSYDFPAFSPTDPGRTYLGPRERIVISEADEATTRRAYGLSAAVRVYGPWIGGLSNDGDSVTLRDKNGVTVCSVRYNDVDPWPVAADGTGHSLVLVHPNRKIDDWRNWRVSDRPGGTPGFESVAQAETPVSSPEVNLTEGIAVVDYGDRWRYSDDNQDLGTAWRAPGYDDSGWSEGPGLLGFENSTLPAPGLQTGLQDFNQLTYYFRKTFVYSGRLEGAVINLDQIVDDGAVYYLNGQEIGRSRMPTGAITFDTTSAGGAVSNAAEEQDVFPSTPLLW